MAVYSEVEVSEKELKDSFKTYGAALDMMTRKNVSLMQQIFEGGSKKVQCLALKASFEAEMLRNQALKKHLQHVGNEDDLKEAIEKAKTLKGHIARFRGQNSSLQQTHQDCGSELAAALEQCPQLNAGKDPIKGENDTLQESCTELRRETEHTKTALGESSKLDKERESSKVQKSQLEEEYEQLYSKRTLEESLSKAEVDRSPGEKGEIHETIIERRDEETLQEQCTEHEEIKNMIDQNDNWQQVSEWMNSKLSPDVERRYLQLKTEYDIRRENVQWLRDDIYSMVKKLAQESCWRKKCEAMELSRDDLEREHEALEQWLKKVTEDFKRVKDRNHKFKNQVEKIELLKAATVMKQQEVDKMQKEVLNLKAMSESYKHIDEDEADIQALNKLLEKKKVKLQKELQTLKKTEVEFQKVTSDSRKLRQTNYGLYKQIATLKDQIARQALLKFNLKTRKSEKKFLERRQKQLQKMMSRCDDKRRRVYNCVAQNQKCEDEITQLQRRTDELQSQYEEFLGEKITWEMWEHCSSHRRKEVQEKTNVDYNINYIISEQRKEDREKGGQTWSQWVVRM